MTEMSLSNKLLQGVLVSFYSCI